MGKAGSVLLCGALLFLCSGAGGSTQSAEQLYEAAINTMAQLPEPPFVSYRLLGQGAAANPLRVHLVVRNGLVWLRMGGGNEPVSWGIVHRSRDYASTVVDERGRIYSTDRSFFDPTWYGAYHALHDGMFFLEYGERWQPKPKIVAKPLPAASPESIATIATVSVPGAYNVSDAAAVTTNQKHAVKVTPAPKATSDAIDANLRTIAWLHVMGPKMYQVDDAGNARCENGDEGRAIRLQARSRPEQHQLTAAIVDLKLTRFCMLRFQEPDLNNATVEQHYDNVGGYWVQTGGTVAFRVPSPMPRVVPHVSMSGGVYVPPDMTAPDRFDMPLEIWRYRFTGMQFPKRLPENFFWQ